MELIELIGCIVIVMIVILIKAEINYRRRIKRYSDLGHKNPRRYSSRTYYLVTTCVQVALISAISILIWGLITNLNVPICINN